MSTVEAENHRYLTEDIVDGQVTTVVIGRMQEWSVTSRWFGATPDRYLFYIP